MKRFIRTDECGTVEVIGTHETKEVKSFQEAFQELGIDISDVSGQMIENATERFETGFSLIHVDEIEREIWNNLNQIKKK